MVLIDYDELFSCFGIQALDVIFNMDSSKLQENEIMELTRLVVRMKGDDRLAESLTGIIAEEDAPEKLRKLLAYTTP